MNPANLDTVLCLQKMILNELGATYHVGTPDEYGPSINSCEAAVHQISDMADLSQEQCRVLCLSSQSDLIQEVTVAMGSGNSTMITAREVFRPAIQCGATAVIVAHNHPSGNPEPSPEDVRITRMLAKAGDLIGIDVIDHLIIGRGGRWASLRSKGFMPKLKGDQ